MLVPGIRCTAPAVHPQCHCTLGTPPLARHPRRLTWDSRLARQCRDRSRVRTTSTYLHILRHHRWPSGVWRSLSESYRKRKTSHPPCRNVVKRNRSTCHRHPAPQASSVVAGWAMHGKPAKNHLGFNKSILPFIFTASILWIPKLLIHHFLFQLSETS